MPLKALLLATLEVVSLGNNDNVTTTSTLLDDVSQCPAAMHQIVKHHNLSNNITSRGREYIKAQKSGTRGLIVLNVSCKELKE